MKLQHIDTLARTIYGEARAELIEGQEAIACVVLNRLAVAKKHGPKFWWGSTIEDICRKKFQFSCWNKNDPNLAIITKVTRDNLRFARCIEIATRAYDGKLKDNTNGATHYLNAKIANPKWDDGEKPTAIIGRHTFYRPKEVPKV
jgi:N-acetylmuramoyl-L-alanine amidase